MIPSVLPLLAVAAAQPPPAAKLSLCPNLLGAAHAQKVGGRHNRGEGADAVELVTLSTSPAVWSVANFLTPEEADEIERAARVDMVESITENDFSRKYEGKVPPEAYDEAYAQHVARLDSEADPAPPVVLKLPQIQLLFSDMMDMPGLNKKQSRKLLKALDSDGDGAVGRAEWAGNAKGWRKVERFSTMFRQKSPEKFTRFSKQAFLDTSSVRIARRVAALLGVPPDAAANAYAEGGPERAFGEALQVVQYDPQGHYNCHHDSVELGGEDDLRRVYTVLFQLRTLAPEKGGQTWFPLAGLDPDQHDFFALEDRCVANNSCTETEGLVVPSTRGNAVVWLNHRSPGGNGTPWGANGEVANLDRSSLHGGCSVARGSEKWIANQWVWPSA
eukprot:CAMPEP_0182935230 /NCGR_PEP_ID=MMETSP0105_2-20130417/37797_1 /TAXON_ID=81532 ORGANISM="Acanthoeca-like sp., Strain 10tr" /NCGR_SAMPLE_ID=MMETSP0105_2 /ASSEMBLY_ACC=CAM_ASM_000205 /LENGTH=387 /DNA_ID=CAMNT_0025074193 /DNA_START=92 /DNA_END=1252 /DNA_ORIENTATION=+